jgi:hypothetical protein
MKPLLGLELGLELELELELGLGLELELAQQRVARLVLVDEQNFLQKQTLKVDWVRVT